MKLTCGISDSQLWFVVTTFSAQTPNSVSFTIIDYTFVINTLSPLVCTATKKIVKETNRIVPHIHVSLPTIAIGKAVWGKVF